MRASWLRCRVPEELEAVPGADPDAPTEPATPAEEPATGPSGAAAVPAPARAAFGHPTF